MASAPRLTIVTVVDPPIPEDKIQPGVAITPEEGNIQAVMADWEDFSGTLPETRENLSKIVRSIKIIMDHLPSPLPSGTKLRGIPVELARPEDFDDLDAPPAGAPLGARSFDRLTGEVAAVIDGESDKLSRQGDTTSMTEITRDELNAKLEALESRMDARVVAIGGKIDAFLAAQVERDKASEYRFGRIEGDLSSIKSDLKSTASDVHEVRRTLSRYMGGFSVGAAVAGLVIGAALKHFF